MEWFKENFPVAASPETPPEKLKELIEEIFEYEFDYEVGDECLRILDALVRNPSSSNEIVLLANSFEWDVNTTKEEKQFTKVISEVIETRDIDQSEYRNLAKSENWRIRLGLAKSPLTPSDVLDNVVKFGDNEDHNLFIPTYVGSHKNAELKTLKWIISECENWFPTEAAYVKVAVAFNPNCSIELLEVIVKQEWIKNVYDSLVNHQLLTAQLLDYMYEEGSDWERELIVRHPNFKKYQN